MTTTRPTRRNERGFSNSIQLTLIFPAVFLAILLALQWALHIWGTSVALAAAQDGARTASSYQASVDAGIDAANAAITISAITDLQITGERTSTAASITVTGRALSVIPGWSPVITVTSSMPLERVTR